MRPFQVFLSYCRRDTRIVRGFYRKLTSAGLTAWMDVENIRAGEEWERAIMTALSASHQVLIFLSTHAVNHDGYFQREILEAIEVAKRKSPGGIFLIPVKLDACPLHPRLAHVQCVDLFSERDWQRLLKQLHEHQQQHFRKTLIGPLGLETAARN
jgi:hypothetical protein